MPAIAKIGPKLAFCGVVSGLILIGWAARHSVAQGPPQVAPPPPIKAEIRRQARGGQSRRSARLARTQVRARPAALRSRPGLGSTGPSLGGRLGPRSLLQDQS